MCTNKTWDAVDPKDAKILALCAEITEAKEKLKKLEIMVQKVALVVHLIILWINSVRKKDRIR